MLLPNRLIQRLVCSGSLDPDSQHGRPHEEGGHERNDLPGRCAGNIAGPFFYKTGQAPTYPLGMWSMIMSHLAEMTLLLSLRFLLWKENRRRDRIQGILRDNGQIDEGAAAARQRNLDATAFNDLTDKANLNFRYIF